MGNLKEEVQTGTHLRQFPHHRPLLVPFLSTFDINSAYSRNIHNTTVSAYLLGPDIAIKHQFGLDREILLIISDFPTLQPRTFQAIDRIMSEAPANGRVDPTVFFLLTPDSGAMHWMQSHGYLNPQTRIPVILNTESVKAAGHDVQMVRRAISSQLYSRDLFNDQLPLTTDLFFVGRDKVVAEILSALRQSRNRGLFGLRKTGKTSILFKIKRLAERDGTKVIYLDCKDPAIRTLHWEKLLERIIENLGVKEKSSSQSMHISDRFKSVVGSSHIPNQICIIFDEIEYISPVAIADTHWHREFIDFWQTLWTTQSELRKISYVLAGVNPTVVELDRVAGMQNPVFSIVTPEYITGLTEREVEALLDHIGPWMGLNFKEDAVKYIHQRYGGHPLLTRMACSHIHNYITQRQTARPATITRTLLSLTESEREDDISQYSEHVVSELSDFYPEEYTLLETLAAGNVAEFIELARGSDYTRHLRGYGLVENAASAQPKITIPIIGNYINRKRAIRLGTRVGPQLVSENHSPYWLRDRISRITVDVRNLERAAASQSLPRLYGRNGFPEAERFNALVVCTDATSYDHFINVVNRCFVEPIDIEGKELRKPKYFWEDIKLSYPDFWSALLRTRLYRHDKMHLVLKSSVEEKLLAILNKDFLSSTPEATGRPYFALQQMVLDGIFVGLQAELERLT